MVPGCSDQRADRSQQECMVTFCTTSIAKQTRHVLFGTSSSGMGRSFRYGKLYTQSEVAYCIPHADTARERYMDTYAMSCLSYQVRWPGSDCYVSPSIMSWYRAAQNDHTNNIIILILILIILILLILRILVLILTPILTNPATNTNPTTNTDTAAIYFVTLCSTAREPASVRSRSASSRASSSPSWSLWRVPISIWGLNYDSTNYNLPYFQISSFESIVGGIVVKSPNHIWCDIGVCAQNTPFRACEYLLYNPAAQTALHPLSWCYEAYLPKHLLLRTSSCGRHR